MAADQIEDTGHTVTSPLYENLLHVAAARLVPPPPISLVIHGRPLPPRSALPGSEAWLQWVEDYYCPQRLFVMGVSVSYSQGAPGCWLSARRPLAQRSPTAPTLAPLLLPDVVGAHCCAQHPACSAACPAQISPHPDLPFGDVAAGQAPERPNVE